MKNLSLVIASTIIFFASCSKGGDDGGSGNTFSAKINGTSYTFNVEAATLLRSTTTSEKRLDITGTSTDGTTRLIITLGEATSVGNGISVKGYAIKLFNEDDPATPVDESLDSNDGFLTFGTKVSNSWVYGVHSENGIANISSCNEGATTISGTFQAVLTDLNDNSVITITAGTFYNIKYNVLN